MLGRRARRSPPAAIPRMPRSHSTRRFRAAGHEQRECSSIVVQASQYDGADRGRRTRGARERGSAPRRAAGVRRRVRDRRRRADAQRVHDDARQQRRAAGHRAGQQRLRAGGARRGARDRRHRLDADRLAAEPGRRRAEIRVRYAPDGSDLGPEEVVSSPTLGPDRRRPWPVRRRRPGRRRGIAFGPGVRPPTQIVAAQLYPGAGRVHALGPGFSTRTASTRCSPGRRPRSCGDPRCTPSKSGGSSVAQTAATALQVPVALTQGRHVWQVTATNLAGLTNISQTSTVFVDRSPPHVTLRITGTRQVGYVLHAHVSYTDAPHGLSPVPTRRASRPVQIKWGDGSEVRSSRTGAATVQAPADLRGDRDRDRQAGNRTVVTRKLKIAPAASASGDPTISSR